MSCPPVVEQFLADIRSWKAAGMMEETVAKAVSSTVDQNDGFREMSGRVLIH